MSVLLLLAAVAGLLAAGYALGRIRPHERLSNWVWSRMTLDSPWNEPWLKQAVVMAALLLTEPRRVYDAARHYDDKRRPGGTE